jgi:hypothetical protein
VIALLRQKQFAEDVCLKVGEIYPVAFTTNMGTAAAQMADVGVGVGVGADKGGADAGVDVGADADTGADAEGKAPCAVSSSNTPTTPTTTATPTISTTPITPTASTSGPLRNLDTMLTWAASKLEAHKDRMTLDAESAPTGKKKGRKMKELTLR